MLRAPLYLLACAVLLRAAGPQVPFPAGWTAVRGNATADAAVSRAGQPSLRLEPAGNSDALAQSPEVRLEIGKRYEVSAWARTENLHVMDMDRTPVATGASIAMASMPFDVHSESLGGTRTWTHLRLRFTATRASDRIAVQAGLGGRVSGRAWFDSIAVEEIASAPEWPMPAAVETWGPAYRYPIGGWIYLHVQGKPYERGYQHGRLLAHEIPQYLNRCAVSLDPKAREHGWETGRTTANALFLRGFDREMLEEMHGIADGANAAGARWLGRELDLVDIVAANTLTEIGLLRAALHVTPTGLEGLKFEAPKPLTLAPVPEHCSAFAATGKATRDGKMVLGHITMWPLVLAEQTNVLLDIQPDTGHRVLMQSYPGGIQSGTDYYQNDAGMVLAETTIRQSPFNARGRSVAYRARRAIQYGTNVDQVVAELSRDNNGLYTNEWLIGDAKDNEVAMYELGTYRTKLYRSSRNEWFGGTEGFYWGCNNAKDLDVRLEYQPDPHGAPVHLPFTPGDRDIKWQELYQRFKGAIDEQFGFLAFRTAPLVSSSAMDAKIATAAMAGRMMMWAFFGKPNEREWVPTTWQVEKESDAGLYPAGYRLIQPLAAAPKPAPISAAASAKPAKRSYKERVWQGWILPASPTGLWLSAGSAAYYRMLKDDDFDQALQAARAGYSVAALEGDRPLRRLEAAIDSELPYRLASTKGALLFDALRSELGDDRFFDLMKEFFDQHTTRAASPAEFLQAANRAAGHPLAPFFARWLDETGLPGGAPLVYTTEMLHPRLHSAILVYGTVTEAGANRYAAEQLQSHFIDAFESAVPVRKDFELTEEDLRAHDIVFVGRPETNSALAAWKDRIGLDYDAGLFRIRGADYASESQALLLAAPNPLDRVHMVLVVAGNSPLETVRLAKQAPDEETEFAVYREGQRVQGGFLPHP